MVVKRDKTKKLAASPFHSPRFTPLKGTTKDRGEVAGRVVVTPGVSEFQIFNVPGIVRCDKTADEPRNIGRDKHKANLPKNVDFE